MKWGYKLLSILICMIILSHIAISEIKIIEVDEKDLVKLAVDAFDEDGDILTYNFSEPLNASGLWQTDYGDAGEYLITITVSDGLSSTSQQVLLKVNPVNHPPEIEPIGDMTIKEGATVKIEPTVLDDDNDNLLISISEPIGDDGIWKTGPDDAGNYKVIISASDGEHTTETSFELTVLDINWAPEIELYSPEDDIIYIDEGQDIKFSVDAKDPDKDTLQYSWLFDNIKAGSDNTYLYKSDYDSAGTHNVELEVSDNKEIVKQKWIIIVENINRPPVLSDIKDIKVKEGETVKIDFSAEDPDRDDIIYKISDPLGNDKIWETGYDDAGVYDINVTISDGELTTSQTVRVTVENVDRPPLFKKIGNVQANEGEKLIVPLEAYDPDGDDITFLSGPLPGGAEIIGDRLEYTPGYDVIQKPDNFFNNMLNALHLDGLYYKSSKDFVITLSVSSNNVSTSQDVKITIFNTNRPPMIMGDSNIVINENGVVRIKDRIVDPDNDRVSFSATEPLNKKGIWKTDYDSQGIYPITVHASDGKLTSSRELNIIINDLNRNPIIVVKNEFTVKENNQIIIKPAITDPDGDSIELSIETNITTGFIFDGDEFRWTPGFHTVKDSEEKDVIVTFIASDGKDTVNKPVLVKVENTNRPPVLEEASPADTITAYLNQPVYFTSESYDPDGDELSYKWKFDTFDSVRNAEPNLERTFTSPGQKTVKLLIYDGEKSITKQWNVNVVDMPEFIQNQKAKTVKYIIDNSRIEAAQKSATKKYIIDNKYVQDADMRFVID